MDKAIQMKTPPVSRKRHGHRYDRCMHGVKSNNSLGFDVPNGSFCMKRDGAYCRCRKRKGERA